MNKERYWRIKNAYNLTINGCGADCFNCQHDSCLADSRQVKRDAKAWIKQKEIERQFYKDHREARQKKAREAYKKVENPMQSRRLKDDLLTPLPNKFTYETAAKIWQVEKTCAIERIKRFIKRELLIKSYVKNVALFKKL